MTSTFSAVATRRRGYNSKSESWINDRIKQDQKVSPESKAAKEISKQLFEAMKRQFDKVKKEYTKNER